MLILHSELEQEAKKEPFMTNEEWGKTKAKGKSLEGQPLVRSSTRLFFEAETITSTFT